MAVVDVYSQVAANLDYLSEHTGKKWDLHWLEEEFGYRVMCGSRVVGREPWIVKVHELISAQLSKRVPKNPKKKRSKPKVTPVIVLLWIDNHCILS